MGPLAGSRVIEMAGIGPGPFCAMMLADMGADVIRVDRASSVQGARSAASASRPSRAVADESGSDSGSDSAATGASRPPPIDPMSRGRRSIGVDLKAPGGPETVLKLAESADAMMEPFRPGVAERLGIGPEPCLRRNPRLVYGRMTGFGQDGPCAAMAGHDVNYIALAGALHPIGRQGEAPVPPLNLVGDFGGGGMYLAFGMVCALLEARSSGRGQVVDAAMVDGAASLMTMFYGLRAAGFWSDERGANLLDTGAPYYNVYETKDGRYISLGSLEPQFYAELRVRLGLDGPRWDKQGDRSRWPELRDELAEVVASKTRDEWCELLDGSDVCFAPVLSMDEAPDHPHNRHRGTFISADGVVQPAPAPRFSRTAASLSRPPPHAGQHTDEVLTELGMNTGEIAELRGCGAVA